MKQALARQLLQNSRGVAMLEMAVVMPLLLFLVVGGLEYSRTLERSQWVSQLSREVANVALRECAAATGVVLEACLEARVLAPLTSQSELLAPGTEYVVAIYSYESGTVTEEGIGGSPTYMSNFRDAGFTISVLTQQAAARSIGTPGNALRQTEFIVVATAYSPMATPVRRILPGLRLVFPQLIVSSTVI